MIQPELTGARRIIHEHSIETARKIAERREELRRLEADKQRLEAAAQLLNGDSEGKTARLHREPAEVVQITRAPRGSSDVFFKKLPRQFTAMDVANVASGWDPKRVYNQIGKWRNNMLILPVSRGVYRKV